MADPCNIRRVDQMANITVATVLGALAAAAAIHFLTPCDGASLCALAVTPTRLNPWVRIAQALRALRIRMLIASFENEAAHWEESARLAPDLAAAARQRIGELRVQLIQCGGSVRGLR